MTRDYISYLYPAGFGNKQLLIAMAIVIATIIIDTTLLKISGFITSDLSKGLTPAISFALVSGILLVFQYLITGSILFKMRQLEIQQTLALRIIRSAVIVGQFAMSVFLVTLIVQIFTGSYFSTVLLTFLVTISYSLSIAAVSLLAIRFLHWYKSNRNTMVLLYGISSVALALNAIITLTLGAVILNDKNPEMVPRAGLPPGSLTSSLKEFLNQVYVASFIASFVMMWISTTLLLRNYSKILGKIWYWAILISLLIYFLSQFLVLFPNVLDPLIERDPSLVNMVLTIFFGLSKPIGGILFGIAFWIVSRKTANSVIRNYLALAGYGFVLFFTANQAIPLVMLTFYPPFGIASVLYVGLSSYLILIGIYLSAISISQDKKVLSDIRKTAINELKLLESIGSAETKDKIIGAVTRIAKKSQANLVQESGVKSSLNEEDMKSYLNDVIDEIKSRREENKQKEDEPQ